VSRTRNRFRALPFDLLGNGASWGSFAFGGYDEQALDVPAAVRFQMDRGLREKCSDAPWSAPCVGKVLQWSLKDLDCKVTLKDLDKRRRTGLKDVWYEIAERGDLFVWTACGLEDWSW